MQLFFQIWGANPRFNYLIACAGFRELISFCARHLLVNAHKLIGIAVGEFGADELIPFKFGFDEVCSEDEFAFDDFSFERILLAGKSRESFVRGAVQRYIAALVVAERVAVPVIHRSNSEFQRIDAAA